MPPHQPWREDWVAQAAALAASRGVAPADIGFRDLFPDSTRCGLGMGWFNEEDEYDSDSGDWHPLVEGRPPYWLAAFGPALTRLTANQALNTLRGKDMVTWFFGPFRMGYQISKYSTAQEKVAELDELNCTGTGQTWPPQDRRVRWGSNHEEWSFMGRYWVPAALLKPPMLPGYNRWSATREAPNEVFITDDGGLLVTSDSRCREATKEEQKQFMASTAAEDADRFDTYLSFWRDHMEVFVFLAPTCRHHTGRVKTAAAACGAPAPTV